MIKYFKMKYLFISIIVLIIFSCEISIKKPRPISATRDTSSLAINEFDINFPSNWQLITKYKGTTLMALSPINDSTRIFRENISVQIFSLNDTFSAEDVAIYMFKQAINSTNSNCQLLNQGYLSENCDEFYAIDYNYPIHNITTQSKLLCKVNDKKAYMLICTSLPYRFNSFYLKEFYPIIKSFRLRNK